MNSKSFVIKTISYSLIALTIAAVIIVLIDPFIRYHKPFFGMEAVETDERYAVIGMANNLDYDTALIGSSMSENLRPSWFEDAVNCKACVKLPLQGAHFSDYRPVFDAVLAREDLKRVYFSLDNYLIEQEPSDYEKTIPDYLICKPGIRDVYYLLNKSVLIDYLPRFIINNIRTGISADNAYSWDEDFVFDKYSARASYIPVRLMEQAEEKPYDYFFDKCDILLNELVPYIENNPKVEFVFYAPPYSILFWDSTVLSGNLTAEICGLERVYSKLLEYDNVRIFYFQNNYELITNLDHYRDFSHFDLETSRFLSESMLVGAYEVTKESYYDTLLEMYNFAKEYDYEACFH